MNNKDFTYYLYEADYLSAVRVVYKVSYTVLTVYYSYRTLLFKPLLKKYKYEESLIKHWYREHSKDLHKDDDNPYEWHFHLMLKKEDLIPFLKDLFELNDISKSELQNIVEYLGNPTMKINNLEYKGSNDIKVFLNYQKKLRKEQIYWLYFKEERYSNTVLQLSSYLLRFDIFNFTLNDNLVTELKNIENMRENYTLKEHEAIKNIFDKITNKVNNFEIVLDYKSKTEESIIDGNNIIIKGENEWQKRLIEKILIYTKLDFYQVDYDFGKVKLDLNTAYLEFLSTIIFGFHSYYYNKHYQVSNLKMYLTDRLNIELSWSFFQASKILRIIGVDKFENILTKDLKKKDSVLLEKYLVKAYFMCYSRFQKCIKLRNDVSKTCLLTINFQDTYFKNSMELCYKKTKISTNKKIDTYEIFETLRLSPFK